MLSPLYSAGAFRLTNCSSEVTPHLSGSIRTTDGPLLLTLVERFWPLRDEPQ
jgi:hypothetical protein